MAKGESNHITSCTIFWENTEDILSVVTKVLQTEIQVRLYNSGNLISGRIWPMSERQKHFKGRRSVDWNVVEDCLKEYIGQCAEITETSDVVYIGADFPDEFAHSKDTKELRGANMYAKANSSGTIKEMVEIATNKTFAENYA